MDLIQHIEKKGDLATPEKKYMDMPDELILQEIRENAIGNANSGWAPYHLYFNESNIKELKPYLEDLFKLSMKRRNEAVQLLEFYLEEPARVKLPQKKACELCGIEYGSWTVACKQKPVIWKLISILLTTTLDAQYGPKVYAATTDAAVHGNHQDRRLYLELTGKLQRGGGARGGAGVNIVFVQDALQRPGVRGKVIDVGQPRSGGELDTSPLALPEGEAE